MRLLLSLLVSFAALSSAIAAPFPEGLLRPAAAPKPSYSEIPIESNHHVRAWIRYFTQDDRERFDRFMERGARYRILVQKILAENGVPEELYYLAMIESGYASRARSSAKAVGIWQFMAPTAREYGLRVDKEVDERLDIRRSTRAAARYLKGLEREFGSWYLAMAAYNGGLGRVRTAIRKHGTRDFWTLARRRALPAETIQYIPKFQAAMHIARNPAAYGFERKTHYKFPTVRRVRVQSRLPLKVVARKQRVPIASLQALNPHLLKGVTPPSRRGGYELWVPL
ncbi:MAG TPA: lytic transglycosylase domain-containing protein [Bdellovibrionales bacterium]|nr:lytic transglycosylase domain-containing protein [Bdellovibrionales bacterium]